MLVRRRQIDPKAQKSILIVLVSTRFSNLIIPGKLQIVELAGLSMDPGMPWYNADSIRRADRPPGVLDNQNK